MGEDGDRGKLEMGDGAGIFERFIYKGYTLFKFLVET